MHAKDLLAVLAGLGAVVVVTRSAVQKALLILISFFLISCMVENSPQTPGGGSGCSPNTYDTWNGVETLLNSTAIVGHPQSCASCHATVAAMQLIPGATAPAQKKINLCLIFSQGKNAYNIPTSSSHGGGQYNLSDLTVLKTWVDNPSF